MRTLPEFAVADPTSTAWRSPLRRALATAPPGIADVTSLVDERQVARLGVAAGVGRIQVQLGARHRQGPELLGNV